MASANRPRHSAHRLALASLDEKFPDGFNFASRAKGSFDSPSAFALAELRMTDARETLH